MRVYADQEDLARAARAEIVRRGQDLIRLQGRFTLALSGGSTPRRLYTSLGEDDLDWSKVELFFGDERCVPPEHAHSNYRMVREALLDRLPIPAANVHRVEGELEPDAAARAYEQELRRVLALAKGEWPRFDLVLLGMGADGHTASLFPGQAALEERERLAVATCVEALGAWRVTLTLPVIDRASCVLFLVAGGEKADAVRRVLQGSPEDDLPARRVQPEKVIWMLDLEAASRLEGPGTA